MVVLLTIKYFLLGPLQTKSCLATGELMNEKTVLNRIKVCRNVFVDHRNSVFTV